MLVIALGFERLTSPHGPLPQTVQAVRDRDRIFRLLVAFKPDIVFHAAALKHVPLLEQDWEEGVKTNVFGSVNVADAAVAAGAAGMVMISTDKAIEPVSVLGATKRFAEMYCQALDGEQARAIWAGSAVGPMRPRRGDCTAIEAMTFWSSRTLPGHS